MQQVEIVALILDAISLQSFVFAAAIFEELDGKLN